MSHILNVFRGDDAVIPITITNDGSVVNITGYTFWLTVKTNEDDTDAEALIQKKVESHTNPTQGITTITIPNSEMNLTPGLYHYDIQMKTSGGIIVTLVKDIFKVKRDITITSQ
jgi:hypothetical protein